MNKKRMISLIYKVCMVCIAFFIAAGIPGCKKNSDAPGPLAGLLVKYEGCKQSVQSVAINNTNRGEAVFTTPAGDCLEFSYDGTGALALKHINAGFNCCPGTLSAEIIFNGNQITITENESQQGCHCMCLFDLYYELKNLSPGSYNIRIIEPNINEDDPIMEFTLELFSAASGTRCLERNHYPWTNELP